MPLANKASIFRVKQMIYVTASSSENRGDVVSSLMSVVSPSTRGRIVAFVVIISGSQLKVGQP